MDYYLLLIVCFRYILTQGLCVFLLKVKKMEILQVHIVQRGAIPPLIEMLQSSDVQLQEMSAFALGRLAQVCISLLLFCIGLNSLSR